MLSWGYLPNWAAGRGSVRFRCSGLLALTGAESVRVHGDRLSVIVQDPLLALTPRMKTGAQLLEVSQVHRQKSGAGARAPWCISV